MPLRQNLPHRIILRSKRINTETEAGTYSVPFSSVTQSCPTLWDPMNRSTPGLPVHHQLLESTQTQVHWVGHAIQPSHSLSCSSQYASNLSQHQGLFKWDSFSHETAKVLEFQLHISPSNEHLGLISFRMDWLDLLAVQEFSRVFSNITVQKHQFFSAELSSQFNSHIHTWLLEKP